MLRGTNSLNGVTFKDLLFIVSGIVQQRSRKDSGHWTGECCWRTFHPWSEGKIL